MRAKQRKERGRGGSDRSKRPQFEQRPLDTSLTEPVTDSVMPPATAVPDLLPFSQRTAQDFERICVVVAREVDGLRDVRLYGVPGQRQDGLDLVGWDADNKAVVYQARRWVAFSDLDLRSAVNDYVSRGRAFSAKRFVVCVAASARRTEIIDELARQRNIRDFGVDLYDQERLSEMLRLRPDLVRRLFGAEWERVFCTGKPPSAPARSPSDVLADALLRGPLDALDLAETADAAGRLLDEEPRQAAELYERIAEKLESSDFSGFSDTYRLRQAECRKRAGEMPEAVRLFTEVVWHGVEKGANLRSHEASRKLQELSQEPGAPAIAAVLVNVLRAVDRWYADPFYEMKDVESAVERLVNERAPGASDAALWLAESAVAMENYDLVRRVAGTLEAIASSREEIRTSDATAVRLRLCIADATRDWEALRDRALRGSLGPRQAALVHARIGRFCAWNADPEAADKSYRLAIGQACQAGINAEAAAALLSIWTVGIRYGLPEKDWGGAHDLSRDVQVAGTDYLQSAYDRRAAALSELSESKLPSALENLRAYLRTATLSGRLASEIDAHSLLGRLYIRAGLSGLATRHYIRAGDSKVLEEWFPKLGSYVDCTEGLDRRAPWERAATFSALAAEGDLIPDDQVEHLVSAALNGTSGQRQGLFGPWVWLSAYKLLAALAPRIPSSYVDPILDLLQQHIEREPNHYRHDDDQHVRIVAGFFLAHPKLRERTGRHLLALMGASPDLGDKVLAKGWDAIEAGRDVLVEGLCRLANDGSKAALRALLYLEVEHPLLVKEARQLLEAAVNRPQRKPGQYAIGSVLPGAAPFVRLLAEEERMHFAEVAMCSAEDDTEMELNRAEGVEAVGIVASVLPDEVRSPLFDRAMSLACAPTLSQIDRQMRAGLHPLSKVRIDLGVGLLVPEALLAAARLAQRREQYIQVIQSASLLFRTGDEKVATLAAHALSCLPRKEVEVDTGLLAASPVSAVRQLAAVLWADRPQILPRLGEVLATDSNRGVRRALASSLATLRQTRPDLAERLKEVLSKDPSASVRSEVCGA